MQVTIYNNQTRKIKDAQFPMKYGEILNIRREMGRRNVYETF